MSLKNPSVEGLLQCQFYSTKELPLTMRTLFELPGDPYDKNESIKNSGLEYLKTLGIFFYRDELHGAGVIIDNTVLETHGFPAWKYSCVLDFDNLRIDAFEEPTPEYIENKGDDRAWLEWGVPRQILSVNEFSVQSS